MKVLKKALMVITIILSLSTYQAAMAMEGKGTEESPFLITTQEELEMINDFPDCYFELLNDIALEGEWIPLCSATTFKGSLNGNGYSISNLNFSKSYTKMGLFDNNYGVIENLCVKTAEKGINNKCYMSYSGSNNFAGIIVGNNEGEISHCQVLGKATATGYYHNSSYGTYYSYLGGVAGINSGTISNVSVKADIGNAYYLGGVAGLNKGTINNSYFTGNILEKTSDHYCYSSGIAYSGTIENCYAASKTTYGITKSGTLTKCLFDKDVSGITNSSYGKSTTAMKMKKTYTDEEWDFDNVWGISADINDGYPYLLWEYATEGSAEAKIIGCISGDNTLKFISEATVEGEPDIVSFGTTFIPLWLFESGSADVATVEYDNTDYAIQNAQTFGATLTAIPESHKDTAIVGKSFIKMADGTYMWSQAKFASVNNTILSVEE